MGKYQDKHARAHIHKIAEPSQIILFQAIAFSSLPSYKGTFYVQWIADFYFSACNIQNLHIYTMLLPTRAKLES